MYHCALSIEVETERIDRQLLKTKAGKAFHFDANYGGSIGRNWQRCEFAYRGHGRICDAQRPERYWITGPERADLPLVRTAVDDGAGGHLRRCRGILRRVELKLHNCLRRERPQVVGIETIQ